MTGSRRPTLRRVFGGIVGVLLLAYVGATAVFTVTQDAMVYPAPSVPKEAMDEVAAGLGVRTVTLETADGVHLYAWHRPSRGDRFVLFFPGNGESIADRMELHAFLVALGWDVLVPAYRGYPGSEGSPSEEGLMRDAEAAWAWVTARVPADRVVVHGKSLGGGVAVGLATRHRPARLVLESTFTSIPDVAQRILPGFPVQWLSWNRYPTLERAPDLDLPVLLLHSQDDDFIPVSHARRNAVAFPDATLFEVDGAGHGSTIPLISPAARGVYTEFLAEVP